MKGAFEIPPDAERDAQLRKLAEAFGARSAQAFVVVVLRLITRIKDPRQVFRVFAAMESEVLKIEAERKARK